MVVKVKLPTIKSVNFHHDDPSKFVKSQWQNGEKSILYMVYRWILSAFYIGIVVWTWTYNIQSGTFKFWWIYMTNWGIMFCTVTTFLSSFMVTYHYFGVLKLESHSSSYKVYWFLSNVSIVLAFLITIVYWAVLFNGKTSAIDVLIHGGNSLGMFIELVVLSHPIYLLHMLYSIIVGMVYLAFSIIYYFAGGVDAVGNRFIYDVLDWSDPLSAALVALAITMLAVFLHVIVSVIQKLRYRLWKNRFQRSTIVITDIQANAPTSIEVTAHESKITPDNMA